MFDVITFGSSTIDIFADTHSKVIKIFDENKETDLIAFSTGSKLIIESLDYTIGGGGTNSACVFSKLGLKTAYMGKMGISVNAQKVIKALKKEKVDTSLVKYSKKYKTGLSLILDNPEKDRVILTYKGANNHLEYRDINKKKLVTKYIYSSSLIGKSFETLIKVSKFARKNNIKFAFNPSSYQVKLGLENLKEILNNTNILIFNLDEAKELTKKKNIDEIATCLRSFGIELIVITDGKNEIFAFDRTKSYSYKPKLVKKVVDTTGAGDCFSATFITSIIKGNTISKSLRLASLHSANLIQNIGAKNGILTWCELNKIKR
jgi:ribokinase